MKRSMTGLHIKVFLFALCLLTVPLLFSCAEDSAPAVEGMVYIPAGKFIIGSDKKDVGGLGKEFGLTKGRFYEDEAPRRKLFLPGYYIDTYEVTNGKYKKFMDATGHGPPAIWVDIKYPPGPDGERKPITDPNITYPEGMADHPVTNVMWSDARGYCQWAGGRLPTEQEWEKAARGPDGNIYPWGNEYDREKPNNGGETAPVGTYKEDKSYYGVYDMGGNVMEWTDSWYEQYPGNPQKNNRKYGTKYKVLRGDGSGQSGHYLMNKVLARGSNRFSYIPEGAGDDGGFRCAKDVESAKGK